ncbi:MAG: threonine synthase [Watsoniomyces obsoletus]|nr:MAG: threonine synthase [Watsoniomyces obsoletus]
MFSRQDLSLVLPAFLQKPFRYTPLGSSANRADETTSTTTSASHAPSWWDVLNSKRVRTIGIGSLVAIVLLVLFFPGRRRGRAIIHHAQEKDDASSSTPAALPPRPPGPDWTRFAYGQYVTDRTNYLCNSVLIFEALNRLDSKPDRFVMYPDNWKVEEKSEDLHSRLLVKMREEYRVHLVPVKLQTRESQDSGSSTWGDSFTKLLAFNQTQYDRVLSLDSDTTLLQHMDELFNMPSAPIAMPRAYWLNPDDRTLSSQVVLLEPSKFELDRLMNRMDHRKGNEYDMDLVNDLYKDNAMVLPHRKYDLLTGEFKADDHARYLGNDLEKWDADKILNETHLVHFSDWPYPKPWIRAPEELTTKLQPPCKSENGTEIETCRDREIWLWLYHDFAERRKNLCGLDLQDPPPGQGMGMKVKRNYRSFHNPRR